MPYFFVLGAIDLEMLEISRVLDAQGIPYTHALAGGQRVRPFEAYKATDLACSVPSAHRLVFVECRVAGLPRDLVCDHHYPGDPGFGLPPQRYLEGSSLGQVLALLALTPTHEQRCIAAADHCLGHAYAGLCPGVDPTELAQLRDRLRAAQLGIPLVQMKARVERATLALKTAPRVTVGGEPVAFFSQYTPLPEEIAEAATRMGVAFCYESLEQGRIHAAVMSAPAHLVIAWQAQRPLHDAYGDPARGFAGGYYKSASIAP